MTVKLTLLDRQGSLMYDRIVNVGLVIDKYEFIGTCEVYIDEGGKHFGKLKLDREVSRDLYFYYRSGANEDGLFWFTGLDLMENEIKDKRTTQLKDMVVG
jgi:hypothetical protein